MLSDLGESGKYASAKTPVKANILKILEDCCISLEKKSSLKLTQRIIELGDTKERVTTRFALHSISDVLQNKTPLQRNSALKG